MGLSSSKSTTTSSGSSDSNNVQTPTLPAWATGALQGYTQGVQNLYNQGGPERIQLPANMLQNGAGGAAANLQVSPAIGHAQSIANGVAQAQPMFAAMPRTLPGGQQMQPGLNSTGNNQAMPSLFGGQQQQSAPQGVPQGAPQMAPQSGLPQVANFTPAQSGTIGSYAAQGASLFPDIQARTAGYAQADAANTVNPVKAQPYTLPGHIKTNPYTYGAAQVGGTTQANSANVKSDKFRGTNLGAYQNPYLDSVVDTTLKEYDRKADMIRAQEQRQRAGSGAFGSRAGIAEAETAGRLSDNRARLQAGMLSDAFGTASNLASSDVDRENAARFANAGYQQQSGLFNASSDNARRAMNVGAVNQQRAQGAAARNAASSQNAVSGNDARRYNTDVKNQASMANADAVNQARYFNAGSQNQINEANAGRQQQAGLFNAGAQNDMTQFGYGLGNQINQFNSGQYANQLDRQLSAAGLMGSLGGQEAADMRANIGVANDVGNNRYGQDFDNLMAPYNYQNLYGSALGLGQFPLFRGVTSSGTQNYNGTQTMTQPGGLFGSLMGVGSNLGAAALMASDRRLKQDIERIGTLPSGLGLYEFAYIWDAAKRVIGVMADEVRSIMPEALGPKVNGFDTVDYAKIVEVG